MDRLLNINCWQTTTTMLFLNKLCTHKKVLSHYMGIIYVFLTFD